MSVLQVLMGAVDSIAHKLVNAPAHDKGTRFGHADDFAPIETAPAAAPDPQTELEDRESLEHLGEWIWTQLKDEEEQEIALYIEEGRKPAEIAEEMGHPVKHINTVLQRIRRRLEKARQEEARRKGESS